MATIKVTHTTNDATNDAHNYLIAGMLNSFCHFGRVLVGNRGSERLSTGAVRCVPDFYICADSQGVNGPV